MPCTHGRLDPLLPDLISNYVPSPSFHSRHTGLHAVPQLAKETHASGPLHLCFRLLPACIAGSLTSLFLFKCPLLSETFLDHFLKLQVLYHSIFYPPAMLSSSPLNTPLMQPKLHSSCLSASPHHQNESSQK